MPQHLHSYPDWLIGKLNTLETDRLSLFTVKSIYYVLLRQPGSFPPDAIMDPEKGRFVTTRAKFNWAPQEEGKSRMPSTCLDEKF
jgi:hypothetical protein